jgi:hypothetical protein
MLIVRNSVRLSALVAALALAGCGSAADGSTCEPGVVKKGCVAILNFRSTTSNFAGVSVPARQGGVPGMSGVKVSDTSLNSSHTFQGTLGGQNASVTCMVTELSWMEDNPEVIIQQEAFGALVNCGVNW